MYTGAFRQVSNRETWSFSAVLTDDAGVAISLVGATIVIGVREPESLLPKVTYTSGVSAELTITDAANGAFSLSAALDSTTFPPGQYEVGVIVKLASGAKTTLIVATLPVVDGVVNAP
jgi:hypothetical protein